MCITINKKLRSYLEDQNVYVVEEAVKLLKSVFICAEKQDIIEALAALKERQHDILDNGQKGRSSKRGSRGEVGGAMRHDDVKSYLEPFLNQGADREMTCGAALSGKPLQICLQTQQVKFPVLTSGVIPKSEFLQWRRLQILPMTRSMSLNLA